MALQVSYYQRRDLNSRALDIFKIEAVNAPDPEGFQPGWISSFATPPEDLRA